jgi:hypothetical protein
MVTSKKKRGLLVSLDRVSAGFRISLDDVVESHPSGHWEIAEHVTRKDVSEDTIDSLAFSEEELASLGHYVLARLHAFKSMGEV